MARRRCRARRAARVEGVRGAGRGRLEGGAVGETGPGRGPVPRARGGRGDDRGVRRALCAEPDPDRRCPRDGSGGDPQGRPSAASRCCARKGNGTPRGRALRRPLVGGRRGRRGRVDGRAAGDISGRRRGGASRRGSATAGRRSSRREPGPISGGRAPPHSAPTCAWASSCNASSRRAGRASSSPSIPRGARATPWCSSGSRAWVKRWSRAG